MNETDYVLAYIDYLSHLNGKLLICIIFHSHDNNNNIIIILPSPCFEDSQKSYFWSVIRQHPKRALFL